MMADSQISLGASLAYGWRLWRANWRAIWGVLALGSLAETVYLAGLQVSNFSLIVAGVLALLVTQPMLFGALFRIAFADRHPGEAEFGPGHAGLQWRAMEWRLLGATALLNLFFMLIGMLGLLLVAAVADGIIARRGGPVSPATPQAILAALGQDGLTAASAVAAIALAVLIFFYIRLRLAFPATADRGKIVALEGWSLSRGLVGRLIGAWLIIEVIPAMFIQTLIGAAVSSGGHMSPAAVLAPPAAMAAALLMGIVMGGVISPIATGVLAYFYRTLPAPPDTPGARP